MLRAAMLPDQVGEAVDAHLLALSRVQTGWLGDHGVSVEERAHRVGPFEVLIVDRDPLANGAFVSRARHAAWRYLLVQEQEPFGALDLVVGPSRELRVTGVGRGPIALDLADALVRAERLLDEQGLSSEVRIVECPSIAFSCLWLWEEGERCVPFRNLLGIEASGDYSVGELIGRLATAAEATQRDERQGTN